MPSDTPRDYAAERIAELRAAAAQCRETMKALGHGPLTEFVARVEAAQRLAADALEAALAWDGDGASGITDSCAALRDALTAFRSPAKETP